MNLKIFFAKKTFKESDINNLYDYFLSENEEVFNAAHALNKNFNDYLRAADYLKDAFEFWIFEKVGDTKENNKIYQNHMEDLLYENFVGAMS